MKIHAFSLIELMVVIAIVAILATIAVPVYKQYIGKAKLVDLINRSQSIIQKHKEYFSVNGRFGDRQALNITGGGNCSQCAAVNVLGDDLSAHIISIAIRDTPYPSPPTCRYQASVDIQIDDSFTGQSFWINQRLMYVNDTINYLCFVDGSSFVIPGCESSWAEVFQDLNIACP